MAALLLHQGRLARLPLLGSLSISILPPAASTRSLLEARPMCPPCTAICDRAESMPQPSSTTSSIRSGPLRLTATDARVARAHRPVLHIVPDRPADERKE